MKLLLTFALLIGSATSFGFFGTFLNEKGYGTAGCGLGSVVFGQQKGGIQILAATTNGTSGSQTFGMTSGTSNCANGLVASVSFIDKNKVALSNDIARGEGEALETLAKVYKCDNSRAFKKVLHKNYKNIFKNAESSIEVYNKINATLEATGAKTCNDLV